MHKFTPTLKIELPGMQTFYLWIARGCFHEINAANKKVFHLQKQLLFIQFIPQTTFIIQIITYRIFSHTTKKEMIFQVTPSIMRSQQATWLIEIELISQESTYFLAAGKLYRYTQIYAVIRRWSEFIIEMEFNSLVIYPPEWRHFQQNGAILLMKFTY